MMDFIRTDDELPSLSPVETHARKFGKCRRRHERLVRASHQSDTQEEAALYRNMVRKNADRMHQLAGRRRTTPDHDFIHEDWTVPIQRETDHAVSAFKKVMQSSELQGGLSRFAPNLPLIAHPIAHAITRDEQVRRYVDALFESASRPNPSAITDAEAERYTRQTEAWMQDRGMEL